MQPDIEVDLSEQEPDYGGLKVTQLPDGSMLVQMDGGDDEAIPQLDQENLAEGLDSTTLARIGQKISEWVEADLESRKGWMERREEGIKRSGITGEPPAAVMTGGATVVHPLLMEAAVQFQARWIEEMFPPDGPCKAVIQGESSEEIEEQRERVENHMNYQLIEEDEEYFEDMDDMGFALPFDGSTFKKSYYDKEAGYVTSKFVRAEHVVAPYSAKSVFRTPRITHIMKDITQNQMKKFVKDGFYLDPQVIPSGMIQQGKTVEDRVDHKEPTSLPEDVPYTLYECYCEYDLEGKGEIGTPYIITVEAENKRVLAIRKNHRDDDEEKRRLVWWSHYKYLPGLGFYGFGLFHAIGGLGDAATGVLRGILDSASAANWQGGFTSKDIRMPDGVIELEHGKWKQTENTAEELKNAFYTPPFREPSAAMFQVLGLLVESGHRFLSTTEAMVGEGATNIPVGTTIARIEQGSKVYSGIHKRCHRVLTQEFKIRAFLNSIYLEERGEQFQVGGQDLSIYPEDYVGIKVQPVSDQHIASTAQRVATAQAVLERAMASPLYDKYEAEKNYLRALKVSNIDALLQKPDEFTPMDPVTEGGMMMNSRGVKAFPEQNHAAHIAVHMGQLQMAMSMPPQLAQVIAPLVQSHLQDHFAQQYRVQMMQMMQVPLPEIPSKPEDVQQLPPEAEVQISMIAAQASQQIMAQAQQANPEAIKMQMDQQKHEADMQERGLRMQKMQQDMAQANQPDVQQQMQQELAKIQAEADAAIVKVQQDAAEAERALRQEMADAIAKANQMAAAAEQKHDATATKAQIEKEAKIAVARIETEHADKMLKAQEQSDKMVEALKKQVEETKAMMADLQKQAKEAEKAAEAAQKLAEKAEERRQEDARKAAEAAAKAAQKQADELKKAMQKEGSESGEITFERGPDGKISKAKFKKGK